MGKIPQSKLGSYVHASRDENRGLTGGSLGILLLITGEFSTGAYGPSFINSYGPLISVHQKCMRLNIFGGLLQGWVGLCSVKLALGPQSRGTAPLDLLACTILDVD